jgi:CubicO group peptidase (beta-lactamase class C family)
MQARVKEDHFSGTVLVTQDGRVLLSKGYGYANLEWDLPNTARTKFRVGSLTKQFTATVIMQLRQKGLLELTDSICKYLQPCVEAWKPVTLHHLLSHTSGLPGYPKAQGSAHETVPPWTAERIAEMFRDTPLEFRPGEQAKYDDWGYYLLGGERLNASYIDMAGPFAAGALYSTVEDLYKWDQALYSHSILPSKALELMWTPVLANFAYGWWVSQPSPSESSPPAWRALPGRLQICHSGGINGFVSEFLRFPNERLTVIVLANTEIEATIGPFLAAIVLGDKFSLPF